MIINGQDIQLSELDSFLRTTPTTVTLGDDAKKAMLASRATVEAILARGQVVYGINTGFGKLANTPIDASRLDELQRNLIVSHAVGVGAPLSFPIVRLAMLLRAQALSRGHSGCRVELVERLLYLLSQDCLPMIPCQGSVGASGDLAPLAHMACLLIGEGEAYLGGELMDSAQALSRLGVEPVVLKAKEGLALINGTQISAAIGLHAYLEAMRLLSTADIACAITLEALQGSVRPFDERVWQVRPHPGHKEVSANMRALMVDSEILESHANCDKVQDQYSLRCVPQVHGAVRDALRHVGEVLAREVNSVTDNPLIFPLDDDVISAGNFHAEPLAIPFDYAAAAMCELGSISERRLENLVNPDLSGLPAFLASDSGVNSGFMIAHVTAAALVSENKSLAHPASVDSIPTSANKEDHVSMAPIAARKFGMITENVANVLAIELMGAFQAMRFGNGLKPGRGVAAAMDVIGQDLAPLDQDRYLKKDVDIVRAIMDEGKLLAAVKAAVPELI
ncbi:MAG: histidine ammonia-lyase [Planctomycetota bacterium]|jgi:histidine ammonia-lyase